MLLLVLVVGVARICTGWHWPVDVITSGLISYVLVKIILSINIAKKIDGGDGALIIKLKNL